MKITDIEVHEIKLDYVDWIAYQLQHHHGPQKRTVYVAHTDTGLEGLGEGHLTEPPDVLNKYIGSNPFDWIGNETSLALGTAMYDLMGKAAGVPVHKLVGQQHRSWVPVGSWTVSTHPDRMAQTVRRYADAGYRWLKFHLSPFENVIDQTRAMQAVAPEGFKIHYDFTMHGTDDHMPELLDKLAQFPVAGCFEDPLPGQDLDGYLDLKRRSKLPIVLHQAGMFFTEEVLMRVADAYMLGHGHIGTAIRRAGLFEAARVPFMLQNVGGNITRAMTAHLMSAFPTGDFHFFGDTETFASDVVKERLEPINGFVRVPEGPGLGVTLDRAELERLKQLELPEQPNWILKSTFKNGTKMYNVHDVKQGIFIVRPVTRHLIPMSYDSPISTEYWDDDGTAAFGDMMERIEQEGVVVE